MVHVFHASWNINALKRFENLIISTCCRCCRRLRFLNHMPCPLFAISKLISVLFSPKKNPEWFIRWYRCTRQAWTLNLSYIVWMRGMLRFSDQIKFLKCLPVDRHIQVVVIGSVFTRLGWDGWCILFHLFKVNIIQPWNWRVFLVSKYASYHMWYE